jgi:SAM-dependent methyltransferase
VIHAWKVPYIVKGMLTYVPPLNSLRIRRGATGGSSSARYCYAVWLRHLVVLANQGFSVRDAVIGELGPGDSIGTGLAGLVSGAQRYVGLDAVPYSANADLRRVLREIGQLYLSQAPIPGHEEFPAVRPRLSSYDFPRHLIHFEALSETIARIDHLLLSGLQRNGREISYHAPWNSMADVQVSSLDLIFSQGVLQCVDDLEETYNAMFAWLKPGGYCSHSVGFRATDVSRFWNGHWAYSDLEWRLVRGRREYLLNREPLSTHLQLARKAGFDVMHVDPQSGGDGLPVSKLAPRFRRLAAEDLRICGAMFILRKPQTAWH